jgi:carboxyl-terminal processing protease
MNLKFKFNKKYSFSLMHVIIITSIATIIGLIFGGLIVFNNLNKDDSINKVLTRNNDKKLQEFIDTYESLLSNYYQDVDKKKLINGAINGMLEALDDSYSTYMSSDETTAFNERMQGDYQGIGAEISLDKDGNIIILKTFKGAPAEKVGLLSLDIIKEVDGKSTKGLTTLETATMLKGPAGTEVSVKIIRDKTEYTYNIKRESVVLSSVTSNIIEKNNKKIGYISIEIFSDNTYEQFKTELLKLEKENISSLIIDVRNNSGGYLSRVSEIVSLFLDKDKIIYQLQDKKTTKKIYSFAKGKREYPIAVLINKYSASASEILAGAMKESYNADIIGVNSFGKGTVQQTFMLDTGGMVKYTIQKWLTPKGNWINKVGITPTIEIAQSKEYLENPTTDNDAQLQKAIEVVSKK